MPFDANGNHALPPGYEAKTGQKVLPSNHNPPLEDLSASLSATLLRSGNSPMTGSLPMGGNKIVDLGKGTSANDAVTLGQLTSASPIGIVSDFAGATAPSGWLLCYGQAVSRTEYAALFAVIGTVFGAGNGSSTFNIPDMRGRVSVGKDDMGGTAAARVTTAVSGIDGNTVGAVGGLQSVAITVDQIPSHNHGGETSESGSHIHDLSGSTLYGNGASGFEGPNGNSLQGWRNGNSTSSSGAHKHTIPSQGGGLAHNNMQPSIILNKIIRAVAA